MKRMTENPMSYFDVTPEDIKNITVVDPTNIIYTYTPAERFLEVVESLKSPLRIDWREVYEPITLQFGLLLSVLYPMHLTHVSDDELGYNYSSYMGGNTLKVVFYHLNDNYCLHFLN